MVILSISNCPSSLRGDLSKWLNEINTGVYIGKLSARVREELWKRICENIKDGQATMIYSAANPQGYEILVHNTLWIPTDFDGITLMKRPLKQQNTMGTEKVKPGFSKASKYEMARKRVKPSRNSYIILDLETTGLDLEKDRIIEIGMLRVVNNEMADFFQCLVKQDKEIPGNIEKLTGISQEVLEKEGIEEEAALNRLQDFIGSDLVVGYNIKFDIGFITSACSRHNIENKIGKTKDVLSIARRKIENIENYRLETVAGFFEIEEKVQHRALEDCKIIFRVYDKLNEI